MIENAPGVDLERDVLAQSEFPLRVSGALKISDASLYHPAPMGLTLRGHEKAGR